MKSKLSLTALLTVLTTAMLLFSPFEAQAQKSRQLEQDKSDVSEKRVALVIGNGAYEKTAALPNPVNDATDMAQSLKDLGFEVISGTNLTKAQMQNLIRQFGNRLADTKGVGLFFYAGHGIAQGATNYLIPVDADIQAEDEIEGGSVSINFVLGKMATANNGFNMVILDACRNNPFARNWRNYRDIGDKGGLTRIDAPTGTLIAYATKPGDVASDGSGRNGLYTGALLKQMRVKNVDITKMFQRVRADVMKQSNGKQVPFDESSVVGDFYFAGYDATGVVQNSPVSSNASKTGESLFWNSIENSTDARDFEDYLSRANSGEFTGTYKATAELKLARLKKANSAAAWLRLSATAKILFKYDYVGSFSEGLAEARIGNSATGKSGFVDKTGREVVPVKYDYVGSFSEGLALVKIGDVNTGKYGFINKTGREVIAVKYDYVSSFSEGSAVVRVGDYASGKYGFVNQNGEEVILLEYSDAEPFSEGLAAVRVGNSRNGKYGFISKSGEEVIPAKYSYVSSFSEGLALAQIGDSATAKYGFIDKTGKEVIVIKNNRTVFPFSEGLAAVMIGEYGTGKIGFIDKAGKEVVSVKYTQAGLIFSEGLQEVRIGNDKTGKWGFIDTIGREVISPKYNAVSPFLDGLASVGIGDIYAGKYGYIDKTGREVIPVKYDDVFWCKAFMKEGFYSVTLNGRKGFADIYGNEYFDF